MIGTSFIESEDPGSGEKVFHGPYPLLASPFVGFVVGASILLISNCTSIVSVT